ncbi:hypothetical protein [Pseudomonas sp. NPDC086251]|uniref:hypothetical protein n=1 Tax=Pseudomonas sp. NPDC086251 TaxID=3364431 RepID=UPI003839B33E
MIDLDQVRRLNIQDGDLLVVPENTEQEGMELLAEALHFLMPGCRVIIVRGPMKQLDVGDMNKLGWYRA